MVTVSILALGVARDANEEREPGLPGSIEVVRALRNISTIGTSICKCLRSSKIISLWRMASHQ